MHADPEAALLVLHQVDVVVTGADGAELRLRQLGQLALRRELRSADLVEHRVVDPRLRGHAHAERDPARDLTHDPLDAALRIEVGARQLRLDRLVAAADVVANARRRDVPLVGNRAANRLAVAGVVVGAQDTELSVAGRDTALELLEAARVDVAERLDLAHGFLLSHCVVRQRHRAESNRRLRSRCEGFYRLSRRFGLAFRVRAGG